MHAVIRTYSGPGAVELFDLLEARRADVERVIGAVHGFVSYHLIRTAEGGVTVTVCGDRDGTEESIRVARGWIVENASGISAAAPTVSEGRVVLHLDASDR